MGSAGGVLSIYALAAYVANQTLDMGNKLDLWGANAKATPANSHPSLRGGGPEREFHRRGC